jgi:hypothetical protein
MVNDGKRILQDNQPLMGMCKLEWQYLGSEYTGCDPGLLIAGERAYYYTISSIKIPTCDT